MTSHKIELPNLTHSCVLSPWRGRREPPLILGAAKNRSPLRHPQVALKSPFPNPWKAAAPSTGALVPRSHLLLGLPNQELCFGTGLGRRSSWPAGSLQRSWDRA